MFTRNLKTNAEGLFITLTVSTFFVPTTGNAQTAFDDIISSQIEYNDTPDFINSLFYEKCEAKKYPSTASFKVKLEYQGKGLELENKAQDPAAFEIFKDEYEVYDCSFKQFRIDNETLKVEYTFYYLANCITLNYDGKRFMLNTIDGGCDTHIKRFKHTFTTNSDVETMKVVVTDDIILFENDNPYKTSIKLNKGSEFSWTTKNI